MSKKRKRNTNTTQQNNPLARMLRTMDAFQNEAARIGYNTPSMLNGTKYPLTRLTRDFNLMNSLYRSNWLVRKIIDTIPNDMLKTWIQIKSQIAPDKIEEFEKVIRVTQTKHKIKQAIKWGRLYGGAAAVIMIEGHEDMLEDQLDYDLIMPDSYKGLIVLDRWSGISPTSEVIRDINNPEFGLPASYQVTTESGQSFKIHHSRVLRFTGGLLPYWERKAEVDWGISEIETLFEELKKRDNTSFNIANLIFLANIRIHKIKDFDQMAGLTDLDQKQEIYETMQAQNHLMNNFSTFVMNNEDDFMQHQYAFTGISEMYQNFMLDLSGATGIPLTKLYGRSPAGMNATGESDLQNYYEMIAEKQDTELKPVLDKLLPIICLSKWGAIPDDFDFDFNPVAVPTEKEAAELIKSKVDAIVSVHTNGIISDEIALKELRQIDNTLGMFSNITDEDIEEAKNKLNLRGELGYEIPGLGTETEHREPLQKLNIPVDERTERFSREQ